MASINDISIAINALFMDITDNLTLALHKNSFLKRYKNTAFKLDNVHEFEFSTNPILHFDNTASLLNFLKKEKVLSTRFQDFGYADEIEALIHEKDYILSLDNFYLKYTIEIRDDEILIFFATNSLVFKYEIMG